MLRHFFAYVRKLRDGPARPYLEAFAKELYRTGYARITACRHLRAAAHLMHWARRKGLSPTSFNDRWVESFRHHLPQCHCLGYGRRSHAEPWNGARQFLAYLRRAGVVRASAAEGRSPRVPVLLDAFSQWMREQRGASPRTLDTYSFFIRDFLRTVGQQPRRYKAHRLRQFVLEGSRRWGRARARNAVTALRMFIRFLIAEGKCSVGLDACVPTMANWRLSALPRYLQPEQVERIVAACDSHTKVGVRDRAIVLLLARLGLRAGDLVLLRLGDIGWKEGWISVTGKGRRPTRLPLSQELGKALVAYLQQARPPADTDIVFLRSRAPWRGFRSHQAISAIVAGAMRRAGVSCPARGAAHLLRHSVATELLRQGASLQDIAALLRHRSIQTTQIYAKVDVRTLRQIAQPWPEGELC